MKTFHEILKVTALFLVGILLMEIGLWGLWTENNTVIALLITVLTTYGGLVSRLLFADPNVFIIQLLRRFWQQTFEKKWRLGVLTLLLLTCAIKMGFVAASSWHVRISGYVTFNGALVNEPVTVTLRTSEQTYHVETLNSHFAWRLSRNDAKNLILVSAESQHYRTKELVATGPGSVAVPMVRRYNFFVEVSHSEDSTFESDGLDVVAKEISAEGRTCDAKTDSHSTAYFEASVGSRWQISIVAEGTYISLPVTIDDVPYTYEADLANQDLWAKIGEWAAPVIEIQRAVVSSRILSKRVLRALNASGRAVDIDTLQSTRFESEPEFIRWLPKARRLLVRDAYIVSYNDEMKIPSWTAHFIEGEPKAIERPRGFEEDSELPEDVQSRLSDYLLSGYDRGHLSPGGDMRYFSESAMKQAHLLSNIAPQLPAINQSVWFKVEKFGRNALEKFGKVYIISGTMAFDDTEDVDKFEVIALGQNEVVVPTHFFRIHIALENEYPIVAAFLVPQTADRESQATDFLVTIDDIEDLTGLDFFSSLSRQEQEVLESSISTGQWMQ